MMETCHLQWSGQTRIEMSTYRIIPPLVKVLPSLLGLFTAIVMAGWPVAQSPAGLDTMGKVRLIDGGLELDAGAIVNFGTARSLRLSTIPAGKSFEMYWGSVSQPTVSARVGARTGLFDGTGVPFDGTVSPKLQAGQRVELAFWCQGAVHLKMDGRVVGRATPPQVCSTAPLAVRAADSMQLFDLLVDGAPVPLQPKAFDVAASVRSAVFFGVGVAILGPTGWGWLVLTLLGSGRRSNR